MLYKHIPSSWCLKLRNKLHWTSSRMQSGGHCLTMHTLTSESLPCLLAVSKKWCRPRVQGMIPGARDGHSACVINGAMYIFGGYEEDVSSCTS